jgi:hypothetical protein
MAVAVQSRRRTVARRPRARRRISEPEAALPLVLLTGVIVIASFFVLTGHLFDFSVPRSLIPSFQAAAPNRPIDGAMPVTKLSLNTVGDFAADALAGPAEQSSESTARLATGARARVANTDNLGVVFYTAPREGTRQPAGLMEGTSVTVLELSGDQWARVQTDAKKAGWVRAEYLVTTE